MVRIRSDKKFLVKVWISESRKKLFRTHCFEHHLSMMFVGEKLLAKALHDLDDSQIRTIIDERLMMYKSIVSTKDNYEVLGIKITNNYWQRLAYFAVYYDTSVAKIGSCIFDYAIQAYEMREVWRLFGMEFKRKKGKKMPMEEMEKRLSQWGNF